MMTNSVQGGEEEDQAIHFSSSSHQGVPGNTEPQIDHRSDEMSNRFC